MASLIPGFEYDVFISYRQKDNKHDGWVTKFVDNLKGELEATFKEDVSVYFDENPHDRLQETHNVDKSLEGKLKCLIFIPILSQTYCDPNSYAWQYEFLAFNKLANEDRFSIDIRLRSSNYTSRILPIRIHDLDQEDIKLFEKETGSVLRAMDFVFKTATGVSRPLKTYEDHPQDNLNKTFYSDQINKVGHAIKEIIQGMKAEPYTQDLRKTEVKEALVETREEDKRKDLSGTTLINQRSKKWLIIVLSIVLCVIGAFAVFKIIESRMKNNDIDRLEKSIAVLPFVNDSPDQENAYFINGLMEEVLNNLQKIKDFRVLSRTSTEQYKGDAIPTIPEIAKKLDVNYIVEGSGQKYGDKFRIRVQLISSKNEKHLWGESYEREIKDTKDIFGIQSQVAQAIASELKATITPDEKKLIEKTSTTNLSAYDFYQRGEEELKKYFSDNSNKQALKRAEEMYYKALDYDSTFALAYIGLSTVYANKHYFETYLSENFLDSVLILADLALSYDDHLAEGYLYRAWYYITNGKTEQAIKEFDKALKYNPNYWEAYNGKGWYIYINDINYSDYVKGLEYLHKAVSINHGIELPDLLRNLGDAYCYMAGFPEEAKYYYQEAFKLDSDTSRYFYKIGSLEIQYGNFEKGIEKTLKAYALDSNNADFLWGLGNQYLYHKQYKESLTYYKRWIEKLKSLGQYPMDFQRLIGFAYWQNGYKKEAEYWFNEQKRFSEESIKFGRSGYVINYDLASLYAFKGEKEKAYKILRIINRNSIFSLNILYDIKKYNPFFDSIRNEPEFQEIVKDVEAKYQAEHERVRKWLEELGKL